MTITPDLTAQILRYHHAERWPASSLPTNIQFFEPSFQGLICRSMWLLSMLGFKAALGLHLQAPGERTPPLERGEQVLRCQAHLRVAEPVSAASVPLVKDINGLLPLHTGRHREEAASGVIGASISLRRPHWRCR